MKPETRNLAIIFGVIFTLVLIVFISLKSRDNKIEKLQNELNETKMQLDALSKSNEAWIEATKITMRELDSIYLLSKKTNEKIIYVYWDSIAHVILNNPDQSAMSEYLRKLGQD